MSDERELRQLFGAITVRSPMQYEIDGRIFHVTTGIGQAQPQQHVEDWSSFRPLLAPLVVDLQMRLYDWAYCRRMIGPVDPPMPATASVPILDALSAANAGRERWEQGWQIVQLFPNGSAQVRKGGKMQVLPRGQYVTQPGQRPMPGLPAAVLIAKESRTMQPGFYYVLSEVVPEAGAEERLARLYFHVEESGAPGLVAAISSELNRYQVPFRFKTLAHSGQYVRTDAAVLFYAKRHFPIVARLLPRIVKATSLRAATPLFTKRLRDGVGLAEDPANGESFGMQRTRLVAQAIWDAFVRGLHTAEARMQELDVQFQQNGLRLDKPWLRASSADVYEVAA
jgi:hypothetical protein